MTLLAALVLPSDDHAVLRNLPPCLVMVADTRFSFGEGAHAFDDGLKVHGLGPYMIVGVRGDVRTVERAIARLGNVEALLRDANRSFLGPERLFADLLRRSLALERTLAAQGVRGEVPSTTAFLAERSAGLRLWRFESEAGFEPELAQGLVVAGEGSDLLRGEFNRLLGNVVSAYGPSEAAELLREKGRDLFGRMILSGDRLEAAQILLMFAMDRAVESAAVASVGGGVYGMALEETGESYDARLGVWETTDLADPVLSAPQPPSDLTERTRPYEELKSGDTFFGDVTPERVLQPVVRRFGAMLDLAIGDDGVVHWDALPASFGAGLPLQFHGAIGIQFAPPVIDQGVTVWLMWEGPDGPLPILTPHAVYLSHSFREMYRGLSSDDGAPMSYVGGLNVQLNADEVRLEIQFVRLDFPEPGNYRLHAIVDETHLLEAEYSVLATEPPVGREEEGETDVLDSD